eukprot:m.173728 g.173728  ORF g.173728 m.173728 type:complete len:200 (-) comp15312_c0_seq2:17-616(-)
MWAPSTRMGMACASRREPSVLAMPLQSKSQAKFNAPCSRLCSPLQLALLVHTLLDRSRIALSSRLLLCTPGQADDGNHPALLFQILNDSLLVAAGGPAASACGMSPALSFVCKVLYLDCAEETTAAELDRWLFDPLVVVVELPEQVCGLHARLSVFSPQSTTQMCAALLSRLRASTACLPPHMRISSGMAVGLLPRDGS